MMISPEAYYEMNLKGKDKEYILSAMGLLSKYDAETALKIMKKELYSYGTSK